MHPPGTDENALILCNFNGLRGRLFLSAMVIPGSPLTSSVALI
ncbi:hypothetical protein EPIB1_2905 [Tritonibacter mobilis]|nr:hypothetical protein EPIB1_2905 [Tritonibacter mobilis]